MAILKRTLSTTAGAAVAALAIYGFWFKGYNPLTFPQELAWDAFRGLSAYAQGSEKVWMVVDFSSGEGTSSQMSFNNPAVPDATLAECQGAIEAATPGLLAHVRQVTGTPAATIQAVRCVESDGDPIKGDLIKP